MSSLLDIVSEARSIKEKIYSPSPIREIVSPEVWLNPYYIGTFYHFMYDYWKPVFCDIVNKGVNEVVLGGSLGGGKSSVGELLVLRKLYELSCYENIPALYGLPPTAQLIFMYLSISVTQSERTGFGRLMRLIDDSPYMRDNFPRETGLNSSIEFKKSKQIACYSGSDVSHFISMDLFAVILDEANFLRGAGGDAGKFSKATEIYRESTNRRKGRFTMGGIEHGISIIVSSADTESSFTESRIEAGKNNPRFYYKNTSILEVKRKDFSSEVFYVFPGVDNFDPFVLSEDNKDIADAFYKASGVPQEHFSYTIPPEEVKESFREVPIDFRETFNVDVVNSLKEVLGVSVRKMMRLYYSKQNWALCLDHTRKHPFKAARLVVSTLTETNELIDNFLPGEIHFEKNTLYFAHIDQSLKRDATGIALSHAVINEYGVLLKVVIDFMLQILAPKDISAEIDISKVRDFFLWLKTTFKIKYGLITYDQYASRESLQQFNKKGIDAELLSVDRDDKVYLETVHLLNKHQISMYNYPLFEWEFFNLKHFLDKRKVDHEEGYSKDLCLSGSVRVSLLSGREISLEEMYNSGKQFWVYSMSDKGLVVPGKTSSVQITGLEKELIRIWLDNGEYVDCTLNHRFMLRDGNYEVAFNLKEGMSLMPLCRKVNRNGYELIMDSDRSYNFTHRRVTDVVYGNVFQDECTHHKDGNKRNNVPENLKRMLISQHYYIHTNGVCIDGIQATRNRVTNLKKYNELEVTKKDQRLRVLKVQELRRQGLIKWNYDNQVKVLDRYRHTEKYKKEHRELVRRLIREGKLKSIQEAVQIRTNKSDLYKEGMTIENILNLRDLGFSNQEIANKLGVKIWAIERKITQARKAGMIIVKPIVTPYNHKIVKIEKLFKKETVYNFSVEPYNNFALSSGVFVHNSDGFVGSVYNCVSRLDLIGKNQTKRDNIAVFLGANSRQDKMDYFNMERYIKR